ncbi:hypothetical protein GUITHDRAFT_151339 [Guillardia theta CCMP2712]|uniref:Uncharacterized protein n=1 Tax=Guillardia theta (strain CCMP2712) TaxID=905079 RepID=L1JPF7_GUITC|nr:hypothetical protein GUITHDRAFT_151339 [Guillardia theta CCMP2712]EKX49948.1 hypothetical protein GUITHDRAFT_151339 [Guillardia theta CCMP2712]|eukprot:XP_005836928.1 hypothetical protein GUITHDRAFT_151339 [Guillardia theta CCMP2712]
MQRLPALLRAATPRFMSSSPAKKTDLSAALAMDLGLGCPETVSNMSAASSKSSAVHSTQNVLPLDGVEFVHSAELQAAQARDMQLLASSAELLLKQASFNWEIEFTTLKFESLQAPVRSASEVSDWSAALMLARGSSFSH